MAENNKRLRQPTKEEYKNLPKTKAEAIKKGITRFNPGDEKGERVIRNYGSKAFPNGIIATAKNRNVTRGSENRRASTNEQTLTRQDYHDYAKRNGHSIEKANKLFELNEKKLNALKARKGSTLKNSGLRINYEHGLPTTSKTYGGVEHWRNILLMDEISNTAKSDLMIRPQSAVKAGIPLSKQSALQMDFNDKPATPPKVKREIIKKDLTENNPIKSFKKNKLWEQLKINRNNGATNNHLNKIATSQIIKKASKLLKNPAVRTAASLGGLSLLGSGLELKAAVDEQKNSNNSLLKQKAADLKLISEALGIQSIGLRAAFPVSLGAKVAELHLRNRDKFEKNRYDTTSDRLANMPTNLKIRKTLPQDAVRSLELK